MGKEFAVHGSRAPLVSALMDSSVFPLIIFALNYHHIDILSVQLLTTSAHVKLAVSLECRCTCAVCVKCIEVHNIILFPLILF